MTKYTCFTAIVSAGKVLKNPKSVIQKTIHSRLIFSVPTLVTMNKNPCDAKTLSNNFGKPDITMQVSYLYFNTSYSKQNIYGTIVEILLRSEWSVCSYTRLLMSMLYGVFLKTTTTISVQKRKRECLEIEHCIHTLYWHQGNPDITNFNLNIIST